MAKRRIDDQMAKVALRLDRRSRTSWNQIERRVEHVARIPDGIGDGFRSDEKSDLAKPFGFAGRQTSRLVAAHHVDEQRAEEGRLAFVNRRHFEAPALDR